jgi:hypothetical protein
MKNSILLRHMLLLSGAILIAGCAAMQPIDVTDAEPVVVSGPPGPFTPDAGLYMDKRETRDAKLWVWFDRAVAFASLASLSLYAADRR